MAHRLNRTAFAATRALRAANTAAGSAERSEQGVLKRGAKRDPELYILGAVVLGAVGLASFYFTSKPTSSSSEQSVSMAPGSRPWETGTSGKYQYHPSGDRTRAPKDAPSALHSVVIPDVNLPKHLHEQFNKYDKEEFDDY